MMRKNIKNIYILNKNKWNFCSALVAVHNHFLRFSGISKQTDFIIFSTNIFFSICILCSTPIPAFPLAVAPALFLSLWWGSWADITTRKLHSSFFISPCILFSVTYIISLCVVCQLKSPLELGANSNWKQQFFEYVSCKGVTTCSWSFSVSLDLIFIISCCTGRLLQLSLSDSTTNETSPSHWRHRPLAALMNSHSLSHSKNG